MKKYALLLMLTAVFMACSKDDDKPKCDECTSDLGNKFKLCDNGNGTYDAYTNGKKEETLSEKELLGLTPKEVVQLACGLDTGQ